jgi:hypothetical protein
VGELARARTELPRGAAAETLERREVRRLARGEDAFHMVAGKTVGSLDLDRVFVGTGIVSLLFLRGYQAKCVGGR